MATTQIKFDNFNDNNTLTRFITHLESIPDIVVFTIVGEALLLQFEAQNVSLVYYTDVNSYLRNDPIIAVGRDCDATQELSEWDMEHLEMKAFQQFDLCSLR